jgi:hypothetical protein
MPVRLACRNLSKDACNTSLGGLCLHDGAWKNAERSGLTVRNAAQPGANLSNGAGENSGREAPRSMNSDAATPLATTPDLRSSFHISTRRAEPSLAAKNRTPVTLALLVSRTRVRSVFRSQGRINRYRVA